MNIAGLQKTTLLDYPGKVACTVFLQGCNFRCPFCQNGEILGGGEGDISEEEFFAFLKKRKGILDGVCVSGGEPLLQDVAPFLRAIKELGYSVKLDTNGAFPKKLKQLCAAGLVDFVAMDVKNSPQNYSKTAGCAVDLSAIEESAAFLLEGTLGYEFRTTVVKELHTGGDFVRIGQWLRGANRYILQTFRDSDTVLKKGLTPCSEAQMQAFKQLVKPFIPNVLIRGEE